MTKEERNKLRDSILLGCQKSFLAAAYHGHRGYYLISDKEVFAPDPPRLVPIMCKQDMDEIELCLSTTVAQDFEKFMLEIFRRCLADGDVGLLEKYFGDKKSDVMVWVTACHESPTVEVVNYDGYRILSNGIDQSEELDNNALEELAIDAVEELADVIPVKCDAIAPMLPGQGIKIEMPEDADMRTSGTWVYSPPANPFA